MKKIGLLLGMATIVAAMSSCSKTELSLGNSGSDFGGKNDKVVSSSYLKITGVDKDGYALTRGDESAIEKSKFENGDAISVWVVNSEDGNSYGDGYNNVKLTYSKPGDEDGTWDFASKIPLTTTAAKLYALYPYDGTMVDTKVALSSADTKDYLYDVQDKLSSSNSEIGLSMKHIRSLLVVNVKRGTYTGKGELSCEISGNKLYRKGSYDLKTQAFTTSSGAEKITMTGTLPQISEDKTLSDQWFVFSISTAETGKLSFTPTIDGIKFNPVTTSGDITFEPGKKYVFTLTINKDYEVTVSKADVENWADGNGGGEDINVDK